MEISVVAMVLVGLFTMPLASMFVSIGNKILSCNRYIKLNTSRFQLSLAVALVFRIGWLGQNDYKCFPCDN